MARHSDIPFRIAPEAGIMWALLVLTVPLPWMLAWLLAAIVHELCHIISIWVFGRQIEAIHIGAGGAEIHSQLGSDLEAMVCLLAGPVGGLLLLLFANEFPRIALCALMQSIFNLLPVFPLDGGRALRSFVRIIFPDHIALKISEVIEIAFIVSVFLLMLATGTALKLGLFPLLVALFFLVRVIKIPCKRESYRVQ